MKTHLKYNISQTYNIVYTKYPTKADILTEFQSKITILWKAEETRDFSATISAFEGIWENFDVDPEFSAFLPLQQAELYRLSGQFLGNYGKEKNRTNYQERGKNLLTKAIEIYNSFNNVEKVAEAQNALALCYYYEGAIAEAEAILEQTASDFLSNKLQLVYLQNRGNLLLTKLFQKKYDESLEIIEELLVPMEFCTNKKACFVFHEKAGNLFERLRQYGKAISHYQRAASYAEEINYLAFVTSINNNLAFLYTKTGQLDLAHSYSNEAIQIAKEDNQTGWLPHFLDTKAAIYFEEGNFKKALETINEAINIFQKGEDAGGLTEALWNKCKFLLFLNRKEEAIKLFAQLAPIANERMGEFAVDNISKEFAELIHVKKDGSLEEETKRFRRVEIITAIRKAKYEIPTAADLLKITHENLTQIIDREFPELFEEINIERFSALNSASTEISQNNRRKISQLTLADTNLPENLSTFYFSEELINEVFGMQNDLIMAVQPIEKLNDDSFILIQNKIAGVYSFGKVKFDEIFDLYFLEYQTEPIAFTLDEVNLIGKAVAYLPFSEIDNKRIEFKPFDSLVK